MDPFPLRKRDLQNQIPPAVSLAVSIPTSWKTDKIARNATGWVVRFQRIILIRKVYCDEECEIVVVRALLHKSCGGGDDNKTCVILSWTSHILVFAQ